MNNHIENKDTILWGTSISPYVRKVMVALAEKDIPYKQHEILPTILLNATGQAVPEEFERSSPLGKIPAIQVGDYSLSDSAVIARYLESKFTTGNSLYPKAPEAYAESLWFEHYSDTTLTDVCYKQIFLEGVVKPKILGVEPDTTLINNAIKNELPPLLKFLNESLSGKKFFSGDSFSMADVAITTQLLALEMYGVTISNEYPNLKGHFKRIISRPSFVSILP
ncbi:MAG: glutathione S-transferase [Coxiella sp. (in: Bacteria)]|nr:MAG: glutathione S-transferase [Coxiella sp. (in: g-proteobacteria)]